MRVDVVMPQMGESIAEGTITRWLKKVGDKVDRDEPIFEISTDKVDAEIPSPAAGVVVEIKGREGETVGVNTVVAIIDTAGGAAAEAPARAAAPPAAAAKNAPARTVAPPAAAAPAARTAEGRFVSPVVRRIAEEHGIDPESVPGTGASGRVTKKDILAFVESGAPAAAAPARTATRETAGPPVEPAPSFAAQPDAPTFVPGQSTVRVPMSRMRQTIAERMVESRRISAHVHSVFEADMTRAVRLRDRYKQAYLERHGTKLTYMGFFIKAVCDALRAWPILNASVEGEHIVYKKDLNIGVAVALDWGLIVPVVHRADEMSIVGLCKRVTDLAERARAKKLSPDDVQDGTFTITNPGGFGGLYGLPIISQPQVGILGIGEIQKRPVVIDDAIAIRSMMYMALSYDHRVIDGAVAGQFLARVKHTLEHFDEALL
jgi:2-oxoglutarate dehydrogenase E2 component (dihydrolipoamide succinyltransferase)